MSNPVPLTRHQLAKFLPNHDAIIAMETLFRQAGTLTPDDIQRLFTLTNEAIISAGNAESKASQAISDIKSSFQEAMIESGIADSKANLAIDYMKKSLDRFQRVVSITANYSALIGNYSIIADATTGDITVTMPLASKSIGYIIGISKEDTSVNTVTIARSGTDLIVGETSQILVADGEVLNFISDGTNWQLAN